jgi:hypothetical protein
MRKAGGIKGKSVTSWRKAAKIFSKTLRFYLNPYRKYAILYEGGRDAKNKGPYIPG